jgi:hypothetical protein
MRIKCNICGKDVSTEVPEGTVVRAWIECPECTQDEIDSHWDGSKDQNALCKCGHIYYRHFDTCDEMISVGCKYCDCKKFEDK